MKRIVRNQRLTPEEAAKYKGIRKQIAEELPDLVSRHQERMAALDELHELLRQLKAAARSQGIEPERLDRAHRHGPLGTLQTRNRAASQPHS